MASEKTIHNARVSAAGADARVAEARAFFPRGLTQPEGAFRFSVDALLLACFARELRGGREPMTADLGAGCGVVGLALALMREDIRITGVEIEPALVGAAADNNARLGLADRVRVVEADVANLRGGIGNMSEMVHALAPESMDAVVANPPYREPGRGRRPAGEVREAALSETRGALDDFIAAASYLLKNRGQAFFVFSAEGVSRLFAHMTAHRLEPKRLRAVHSCADKPARLVLVEARKNGGPELLWEPPLVMYEKSSAGGRGRLTIDARTFCPFMACNSGEENA
ncbi:methyltransferase [Oceanidesulfovibrio indonesiensis]|uniref:Methyltransferase n=1 Tax=Oceanidesulfovibrio indonesiensis TaxID=54767 RepID=A0A7M3MGN1_9BACT|nr:methyltransferase [Oceanidesulfovibrio indonesiensis]TVM18007.1 methyltransferase [Oceanidesulfovibrio indonesiensis]